MLATESSTSWLVSVKILTSQWLSTKLLIWMKYKHSPQAKDMKPWGVCHQQLNRIDAEATAGEPIKEPCVWNTPVERHVKVNPNS